MLMSDGSAILVFARGPRVESRLKLLGRGDRGTGASAATLLLEHSLAVARGSGADTIVAGDEEIARSRPAGVRLLLQRGTGFGERLRNAVADTFALGYRRVVVIGTDTPALSPVLCDAALKALAVGSSRTVVLGPSRDGGYYLHRLQCLHRASVCRHPLEDPPRAGPHEAGAERLPPDLSPHAHRRG